MTGVIVTGVMMTGVLITGEYVTVSCDEGLDDDWIIA